MAYSKRVEMTLEINSTINKTRSTSHKVFTGDDDHVEFAFSIVDKLGALINVSSMRHFFTIITQDGSKFQMRDGAVDTAAGTITYKIPKNVLDHSGVAVAQLSFEDTQGKTGTAIFSFKIEQSLIDRISMSEQEFYIYDFESLKQKLKDILAEIVADYEAEFKKLSDGLDQAKKDMVELNKLIVQLTNDIQDNIYGLQTQLNYLIDLINSSKVLNEAQVTAIILSALMGKKIPITVRLDALNNGTAGDYMKVMYNTTVGYPTNWSPNSGIDAAEYPKLNKVDGEAIAIGATVPINVNEQRNFITQFNWLKYWEVVFPSLFANESNIVDKVNILRSMVTAVSGIAYAKSTIMTNPQTYNARVAIGTPNYNWSAIASNTTANYIPIGSSYLEPARIQNDGCLYMLAYSAPYKDGVQVTLGMDYVASTLTVEIDAAALIYGAQGGKFADQISSLKVKTNDHMPKMVTNGGFGNFLNTETAYIRSASRRAGAWGNIMDVSTTKDGKLACILHSDDLSVTTFGSGTVGSKTMAELEAIQTRSSIGGLLEYVMSLEKGIQVLTARNIVPIINLVTVTETVMVNYLKPLLTKYNLLDSCILSTGNYTILKSLRKVFPNTKLMVEITRYSQVALDNAAAVGNCTLLLGINDSAAFPNWSQATPEYNISAMKEKGVGVAVRNDLLSGAYPYIQAVKAAGIDYIVASRGDAYSPIMNQSQGLRRFENKPKVITVTKTRDNGIYADVARSTETPTFSWVSSGELIINFETPVQGTNDLASYGNGSLVEVTSLAPTAWMADFSANPIIVYADGLHATQTSVRVMIVNAKTYNGITDDPTQPNKDAFAFVLRVGV